MNKLQTTIIITLDMDSVTSLVIPRRWAHLFKKDSNVEGESERIEKVFE